MKKVGISVVSGLSVGIIAAALIVALASGQQTGPSPEKQAFERTRQAQEAVDAARPHAPKTSPGPSLAPRSTSCPIDVSKIQTGIVDFRFGPYGKALVNIASVVSTGKIAYTVLAGAQDDDPKQGIVIVVPQDRDSCATLAGLSPQPTPQTYLSPSNGGGALKIVQVDGDTVVLQDALGKVVRFNYVQGRFLAGS